MTHILGIDPGYDRCGYAVIDEELNVITSGVIQTNKEQSYQERIQQVYLGIRQIIDEFRVNVVGVEKPFTGGKNVGNSVEVGGVWAVIGLAIIISRCEYMELFTTQVKAAVANGRASKAEVKHGVETILDITLTGHDDESDALAAAICTRDKWQLERLLDQ